MLVVKGAVQLHVLEYCRRSGIVVVTRTTHEEFDLLCALSGGNPVHRISDLTSQHVGLLVQTFHALSHLKDLEIEEGGWYSPEYTPVVGKKLHAENEYYLKISSATKRCFGKPVPITVFISAASSAHATYRKRCFWNCLWRLRNANQVQF